MENVKGNITKICSFYVSEWHLTTMLLPYINEEIEKENNVSTILERNLEDKIKILIERTGIKNKNKVLNINWDSSYIVNIDKIIADLFKNKDNKTIIVNGNVKYINEVNKKISNYVEKNNICQNIKIINCYEVTNFENNFDEILNLHNKVLNTTGERKIEDVFNGYKNMKII